ncbi:MAG: YetF domain-containing protein [Bacillota bacterium]
MDVLIDGIKVIGRIVTMLPFMLAIGLYMGKRSIGELPVFDVLVIIVLGAVVGADIADPKIGHIHTFIAVIAVGLLHRFITILKLKYRKVGHWITFEPTIVVYKGEFLSGNMKKINYSIDNVLQMLREKDVFQVSEVELAIVEASGRLSVALKPEAQPVTAPELGLQVKEANHEIPVILDGQIDKEVLRRLKRNEEWLLTELKKNGVDGVATVFFATVNLKGEWSVNKKGQSQQEPPPIFH